MKGLLKVFYLVIVVFSCSEPEIELRNGTWRGVIELQGQQLPFNFIVSENNEGKKIVTLLNAGEKLILDSIKIEGDSISVGMHIFDAEIKARISGSQLKGVFVKNYVNEYKLPFKALYDAESRFEGQHIKTDLRGKYKMHFENDPDSVYKVGLFKTSEENISGTVLTISGDQRFLEGITTKDSLFLSAFNGENAYLYKAKINPDHSIEGRFYSGKGYQEAFIATPNDTIELPNANLLTFLKPGYNRFTFSFPGIDGKKITLEDPKYQNKVVIVQLLGSWCPNCMDETRFLAPWYRENKQKGVEIIGLAYEKKDDFEYAKKRLTIMKDRLGVEYDIAFAGSTDKENTSKSLPMLNKVMAFPTTIFIDKKGDVRKIHTGFSGPGTGHYYEKFLEEFDQTVNALIKEE